jgi:hypothetical protein
VKYEKPAYTVIEQEDREEPRRLFWRGKLDRKALTFTKY